MIDKVLPCGERLRWQRGASWSWLWLALQLKVRKEQHRSELSRLSVLLVVEANAAVGEGNPRGCEEGVAVEHATSTEHDDDVARGAFGVLDSCLHVLVAILGDVADDDERVGRAPRVAPEKAELRVRERISAARRLCDLQQRDGVLRQAVLPRHVRGARRRGLESR